MVEVLYKGRKRKVHSGSRGGKYVVVQGTKRYLKVRKSASKKKPAKKTTKKCVGCKNMKCVCIPRKKKVVKRKPQKKKKPAKRHKGKSLMNYFKMSGGDEFQLTNLQYPAFTVKTSDFARNYVEGLGISESLPIGTLKKAREKLQNPQATLEEAMKNTNFHNAVMSAVSTIQKRQGIKTRYRVLKPQNNANETHRGVQNRKNNAGSTKLSSAYNGVNRLANNEV